MAVDENLTVLFLSDFEPWCYFCALRGVGTVPRRETLKVARANGTVDCKGFERLVQLARRRPGEAPALPQP